MPEIEVPVVWVPERVPVMVMLLPLVKLMLLPETVPVRVMGVPPMLPVTVTLFPDWVIVTFVEVLEGGPKTMFQTPGSGNI